MCHAEACSVMHWQRANGKRHGGARALMRTRGRRGRWGAGRTADYTIYSLVSSSHLLIQEEDHHPVGSLRFVSICIHCMLLGLLCLISYTILLLRDSFVFIEEETTYPPVFSPLSPRRSMEKPLSSACAGLGAFYSSRVQERSAGT